MAIGEDYDMILVDLSIADLENRTGWHFSDSDRQWLLNYMKV